MKNQKGSMLIFLAVGIVIALGVIGYVLYGSKLGLGPKSNLYNPNSVPTQYQGSYNNSGQSVGTINSASDLDKASASLDAVDTAQMDTELKALNSASSGF